MDQDTRKKLMKKFNERIKILKKKRIIIEGEKTEVFEDYYKPWVCPKEIYGELAIQAMNNNSINVLNFETRYCKEIAEMKDRNINKNGYRDFVVMYEGSKYEIFKLDFLNNSKDIVVIKTKEVD